jgi:hypothetical protein
MLGTWLRATSGANIEYIGSVTKSAKSSSDWDSSGDALDVLSIAQTGDLVVIAFTFEGERESGWDWQGMVFTDVLDETGTSSFGRSYAGYHFVELGDTNPYVSKSGVWDGLSIVASVFRNVSSFVAGVVGEIDQSGLPDPFQLTANGNCWVVTGHSPTISVTDWGAPSNYTLADFETYDSVSDKSSTVIAYRIEPLTFDDPSPFTGTGSSNWRATTMAFA